MREGRLLAELVADLASRADMLDRLAGEVLATLDVNIERGSLSAVATVTSELDPNGTAVLKHQLRVWRGRYQLNRCRR
jgi:hypothetical protein